LQIKTIQSLPAAQQTAPLELPPHGTRSVRNLEWCYRYLVETWLSNRNLNEFGELGG